MLRVAILGASGIASAHIASCRRVPDVEVCAIYSRSLERAERVARVNELSMATDELDGLLSQDDIHAVIIATEPSRHIDLALRAMRYRKHLLIEKPIDTDYSKAVGFARTVGNYDGTVSVVSQYRFDSKLQEMKQCLSGMGGQSLLVNLQVFKSRSVDYYDFGNGWRQNESDYFVNQACHWLDVLNWYFGDPVEVHALSLDGRSNVKCVDRSVAILRYANGSLVTIAGGSFSSVSVPVKFVIHGKDQVIDYGRPTRTSLVNSVLGRLIPTRWCQPSKQQPSALDLQILDFVSAIGAKSQPSTTVDQAISALRLSLSISGRMKYSDTL